MIETTATVERVEGDAIWVRPLITGGGCGSCQSSNNCSTSFLNQLFQGKTRRIKFKKTGDVKVNDQVILVLPSQELLFGSALIYLLPLVLLFLGAVLGEQLFNEVGSIGFGFLGLFFGLWLTRFLSQTPMMQSRLQLKSLKNDKLLILH